MSKGPQLTDYQREKLKRLVLDCIMMRYSIDETIDYVQKRLHVKLAYDTMAHIRSSLRRDAKKEFDNLRQDKFEFHYQFMQRIEEIRNLQHKQWELYESAQRNPQNQPLIQLNCLKELHSLTRSLANLYDLVPVISRLGLDAFASKNNTAPDEYEYKYKNDPRVDPNRKF